MTEFGFRTIFCAAILLLLGVSGCSSIAPVNIHSDSPLIADVLSGEALLGHKVEAAELPHVDLLSVTPEMKLFAKNTLRRNISYFEKIKNLHVALLSSSESGGRGIAYSAYVTESPINAFEQRRVNCLSFTLLYVAMARSIGIDAHVNQVEVPPRWDMRNKKDMVFLRHVNAKVSMRSEGITSSNRDDIVIDLEMDRYKATYRQYEISDEMAAVQFYSNRAMEYLEDNNFKDSFLNLRKSISLNDQQSYVWSNLGALYARKKMWREAELSYLHGLSLNSDDLTLMNNLGSLYSATGNKVQAEKFIVLAQHYRESNPFFQYNLALSAFEHGAYDQALEYVLVAIKSEKKEVRFYQLASSIYAKLGRHRKVLEMEKIIRNLELSI